jgi:hypothetical protein
MQTIQANNVAPARAGTLGLPACPRLPSDVFPYTITQAERDVATLSWLAFEDRGRLELLAHEDETFSCFDSLVGDSVAEGRSAYDCVDNACDELLPRGVRR